MSQTDTRARRPQNEPLAVRPLTVEVRSEVNASEAYTVTLPYCPCKDFYYRRGNLASPFCKHLRAAMGLVGSPSRDTSRLDWEAAADLLTDFGITKRAADGALGRAQVSIQGVHLTIADGLVVIIYNKAAGTYDVRLAV
jgi:hypothetical protein